MRPSPSAASRTTCGIPPPPVAQVSTTNSLATGGFGGSARAPVFGKYGDFGISGLYGWGVGRYGDTTLADVTFDATGQMMAITNASALATLELNPTKRLVIYGNFGEDFAGRLISTNGGTAGYALLNANNSGCNIQSSVPTSGTTPSSSPANCNGNNKFVQEFVGGFWYDFYKGRGWPHPLRCAVRPSLSRHLGRHLHSAGGCH
jgi:hypothetical protein